MVSLAGYGDLYSPIPDHKRIPPSINSTTSSQISISLPHQPFYHWLVMKNRGGQRHPAPAGRLSNGDPAHKQITCSLVSTISIPSISVHTTTLTFSRSINSSVYCVYFRHEVVSSTCGPLRSGPCSRCHHHHLRHFLIHRSGRRFHGNARIRGHALRHLRNIQHHHYIRQWRVLSDGLIITIRKRLGHRDGQSHTPHHLRYRNRVGRHRRPQCDSLEHGYFPNTRCQPPALQWLARVLHAQVLQHHHGRRAQQPVRAERQCRREPGTGRDDPVGRWHSHA